MAYGLPIIFMWLGWVVAITWIDMVKSSLKGMYSLVWYAFSGIGALLFLIWIWVLIDAFQKRKRNNVKWKNIVYIGIIQAVEKAWSFRTVPLWFGVSEKDITDIDSSIAEDEEIDPALYGYPYRFQVNINGITYTTQVFSEPFPKKYSSGGKIRIYFNDMSYSGEFVTDLDSIDELN